LAIPQPRPEARRASQERILEGLFLASPLPMLLVDARSRSIVRANTAMGNLVGWPITELKGVPLRQLDPTEALDVEEYLLLAVACRDDRPRRYLWHTRSGEEIPVEVQAGRLHHNRGTLIALYVRDAREQRQVEEDRSRLQSQLVLAQKHEAVGRLVSRLAHDFNDLLSTIMRSAERVRLGPESRERLEAGMGEILESGRKARQLITELTAFSGQQEMQERTVSLNDVVTGAEDLLRETLSADVGLLFRLDDGELPVNVDPAQLRQVLIHLVENARDAMPDGGYVVVATEEVALDAEFATGHPSVQPGPHVVLSVTDTGTGMDEETRSRIFEPFFSTRGRGAGAGLGLATVYGIVKQCGGSIAVSSQPGVGTTFLVYLPKITGV
jgi:PAS domain S-box-containing protein